MVFVAVSVWWLAMASVSIFAMWISKNPAWALLMLSMVFTSAREKRTPKNKDARQQEEEPA